MRVIAKRGEKRLREFIREGTMRVIAPDDPLVVREHAAQFSTCERVGFELLASSKVADTIDQERRDAGNTFTDRRSDFKYSALPQYKRVNSRREVRTIDWRLRVHKR